MQELKETLVDAEEIFVYIEEGRKISEEQIVSDINANDIVRKVCAKHMKTDNDVFLTYLWCLDEYKTSEVLKICPAAVQCILDIYRSECMDLMGKGARL